MRVPACWGLAVADRAAPSTRSRRGAWRLALSLLYVAACVVALVWQPRSLLSVTLFVAPCVSFGVGWLWRRVSRPLAVVVAVLLPVAWLGLYPHWAGRAEWVYVGEYALVYVTLALWFAGSLRGTPLITRVARRVHPLTPDMVAYTVKLTRAWAVYFATMAALSLAVYALGGLVCWGRFTLLVSPLSLVVFFVAEHWLRYRWHPEFDRATLAQAVRGWRQQD